MSLTTREVCHVTRCLPYPPSVHHLWAQWRGRRILSEAGREYHRVVGHYILATWPRGVRRP